MTYLYRREDGTEFEVEQRISDPPLAVCPTTGQKVERVICCTARPVLLGVGWTPIHHGRA